jgi:hypothetical protein
MKWRIVANGAALVVTISVVVTAGTAGLAATQSSASATSRGNALTILAGIRIEKEQPSGYQQPLFKRWKDVDGDGCDSREQVLIRDSKSLPQMDGFDCSVVAGDWVSPYDGARWEDPSNIDIDHVVALKEVWDSGGWAWSEAARTAYANDTTDKRTLLAVTKRINQQKGAKDPSNWMPPLRGYWCKYLSDWISIKARWKLSMDQSEFGRIKNVVTSSCPGLTIAKWKEAPLIGTMVPVTVPVTSVTTILTTRTTTNSGSSSFYVTPGAFCTPGGATGYSSKGVLYMCKTSNTDSRNRWRQ